MRQHLITVGVACAVSLLCHWGFRYDQRFRAYRYCLDTAVQLSLSTNRDVRFECSKLLEGVPENE